MQTDNYKRNIIVSIVAGILLTTVMVIVFWKSFGNHNLSPGLFPFLLYALVLLVLGFAVNEALKALNPQLLKNNIDVAVEKARLEILKEYEQKMQEETISVNEIDNQEIIKQILPKGNFKNPASLTEKFLKNLSNTLEFVQGIVYMKESGSDEYTFSAGFALSSEQKPASFKAGENLSGQTAITKEIAYISEVPGEYMITSGLGEGKPVNLVIAPVLVNNEALAILELATFKTLTENSKTIINLAFNELSEKIKQLN